MTQQETLHELFKAHNITDEIVQKDFLALLSMNTKNKSVTSRPANIIFKDVEYEYCRNTGHYFTRDEMVYNKDGKSKGNSKIGNSFYSLAQKAKKNVIISIDELKTEIIKFEGTKKERTIMMNKLSELETTLTEAKWADGLWMVENYYHMLKQERQDQFDKIAFKKEDLI